MKKTFTLIFLALLAGIGNQAESEELISSRLLQQRDLEIVWEMPIPKPQNDSLRSLFLEENRFYALTRKNYMVAADRNSGEIHFVEKIAPDGIPVNSIEHYEGDIRAMIGDWLYDLDMRIGALLRRHRMRRKAVSPIIRDGDFYYLAGADGRLRILRAEDRVELFNVKPEDDSAITWVTAGQTSIYFSTEGGSIYAMQPGSKSRRWEFTVDGPIRGPIVYKDGGLYFAASNAKLYRIDPYDVSLVWRYQTTGVLDQGPLVIDDVVYQKVPGQGMVAIDASDGERLWKVSDGRDLLSKDGQISYVITDAPTLVVMDNNTGKKIYSLNLAGVEQYIVNASDSKIYLAGSGRMVCIKPGS